ncbi:TonB-dependent receptor [Pseudoalteromonas luteoviolacea B = ATCC 29581]|nr:TonB-dependent receptor [Pseudoalteromonas luteoviolacea B = ATCC 29581]
MFVPLLTTSVHLLANEMETIVTTATRTNTVHLDLIGNTSTISEKTLEDVAAEHLNQALSFSSGTWLSRGNGQESLLSIRSPVLTGSGSCSEFLMLEDGVSLRANGFCNVNQLFDSHFEAASLIEVVKGANSARYGSNAIHGTVNLLSASLDTPRNVRVETASYGFKRVHTDLPFSQLTNPLLFSLTLTDDDGYQDSSGYEQQKLSIAYQHEIRKWQATHRVHYTHLDQQTAGYLQQGKAAYQEKALLKINEFPDAYRNNKSFRYSAILETLTSNGLWQVTPYVRANEMDFLMHFLPGTPVEENEHKSVGLNILNVMELNDMMTFKTGIDSDYTSGSLLQYQIQETLSSSAFLKAILPKGQHYDYQVEATSLAMFTSLDVTLLPNLNAFASLRFDSTHYDYTNHMIAGNTKDDGTPCNFGGCRYTRPSDTRDNFNNWSYAVGVSYRINDNNRLFLKLDDAFRAPHTSELYRLQNGQLNADIDSVNAEQFEFGYRFASENWFAEASLYSLSKTNGIFQDTQRQYINGLDTKHRGLELDLNVSLTQTINATLNATYGEHTFETDGSSDQELQGNTLDSAPKWMINSNLTWFAKDSVELSLQAQYLSDYYLNVENTEQYDGHHLLHLRSKWKLNRQVNLRLNIINLLDESYAERADFAFGNHRYFVGKPRTVSVILDYQF